MTLARRLTAESLGTAFLLATVVGSGIMGERLAGGNVAIALLANSVATGAALIALIATFAPISGAHFNPVISMIEVCRGGLARRDGVAYVVAQLGGALLGVATAHLMFGEHIFTPSLHQRSGVAQLASEVVATFGLVGVVLGCAHSRPRVVPFAVGAYITAAYWFTASTSFANPAVTVARSLSNTFAGIRPADVPGFIAAQVVGGCAAAATFGWLLRAEGAIAREGLPSTNGEG